MHDASDEGGGQAFGAFAVWWVREAGKRRTRQEQTKDEKGKDSAGEMADIAGSDQSSLLTFNREQAISTDQRRQERTTVLGRNEVVRTLTCSPLMRLGALRQLARPVFETFQLGGIYEAT